MFPLHIFIYFFSFIFHILNKRIRIIKNEVWSCIIEAKNVWFHVQNIQQNRRRRRSTLFLVSMHILPTNHKYKFFVFYRFCIINNIRLYSIIYAFRKWRKKMQNSKSSAYAAHIKAKLFYFFIGRKDKRENHRVDSQRRDNKNTMIPLWFIISFYLKICTQLYPKRKTQKYNYYNNYMVV